MDGLYSRARRARCRRGSGLELHDLPRDNARRLAADERHKAADALVDSTGDAKREIVDEMCRLPARTIEGLAFKARVSFEREDNFYPELVTSITDDILAMGARMRKAPSSRAARLPRPCRSRRLRCRALPGRDADAELLAFGSDLEAVHSARVALDEANDFQDDAFYVLH